MPWSTVVDLRDYKIKGDGTPEIMAEWEKAIREAESVFGAIFIPPTVGFYNLSSGLTITQPIGVFGSGWQGSRLRFTGTFNALTLPAMNPGLVLRDFVIERLTGDGSGIAFQNNLFNVLLDHVRVNGFQTGYELQSNNEFIRFQNCMADGLKLASGSRWGLRCLAQSNGVEVHGGTYQDYQNVIEVNGSDTFAMYGGAIQGADLAGINLVGAASCRFYSPRFEFNATWDINIDAASVDNYLIHPNGVPIGAQDLGTNNSIIGTRELTPTLGGKAPVNWLNQNIHEFAKAVDPGNSAANNGRFFLRDNGSGKMQFCARFPTGAIQVIATEP